MKKVYLLLLLVANIVFAQVPQGISHRGTAYNTDGTLITDTQIKIRVSIINGPPIVYQETHNVLTNSLGQYSLKIGMGIQISSGGFDEIDWGTDYEKYLKIEIDPTATGASYPIMGQNQLMSVPYALYSESTASYQIVDKIDNLRSIIGKEGDIIYVKGHTTPGDGGGGNFMWSKHPYFIQQNITTYVWDMQTNPSGPVTIPSPFYEDNDGTIIKVDNSNAGRWVRQYDNYIDVRYFGVFGNSGNQNHDTKRVESAIDFAYQNGNVGGAPTKGTTVFFPNGGYILNSIRIRNGVALLGDSMDKTVIIAALPQDPEYKSPSDEKSSYLFQLDEGVVQTTITNFNIVGRGKEKGADKGCFYLVSQPGPPDTNKRTGGLWNSAFENIKITGFKGNGMYLKGGGGGEDYNLPFQFNTYKNVSIGRLDDNSRCLKMEGAVNQQTFINCLFDGYKDCEDCKRSLNENIEIINSGALIPGVYSFINCSIQDSNLGVKIRSANGVTFDTCWFESLGIAVMVESDGVTKSKGVNIVNNFFANSAGFGSLKTQNNITQGMNIHIKDSYVNVLNNFVRVSLPDVDDVKDDLFIYADEESSVNVQGNTFQAPVLGNTIGIMSVLQNVISNTIDCKSNKEVFVNSTSNTTPSSVAIHEIKSEILASESLLIRANNGNITFYSMDQVSSSTANIYLAGKPTLTLASGQVAIFTKIDNTVGTVKATYQLSSIVTVNSN